MERIVNYLKASYFELVNEVTWPEWSKLQKQTAQVLAASLIIALILYGMDRASVFFLNMYYGI